MTATTPILEVRDLTKHYPVRGLSLFDRRREVVRAVDGVSLTLAPGRTLGLVGESGCGKSTLGKLIIRLEEATAGTITYDGKDFGASSGQDLRQLRRNIQIIFQDPFASLNPRMTVGQIVTEPFRIHRVLRKDERTERMHQLLEAVGLRPAFADRYPHEFSGGQRQRIGIARAIALNPRLLVCDEPVSALDVSIQAQVLNLLVRLQRDLGLSYLFIAHGLAAVKHISDDIGVMYLGKIVEMAPKSRLFEAPAHPYTQALISAIPAPNPRSARKSVALDGDVPSPINPPPGCRFHTRCPMASTVGEACRTIEPRMTEIAPGHTVACHLHGSPGPRGAT